MYKVTLAFLVTSIVALVSLAATDARADTSEDNETRMRETRIRVGHGTSADYRHDKRGHVSAAVGLDGPFGFRGQATAGAFLAPTFLLALDLEAFTNGSSLMVGEAATQGVSAGPSLTWFPMNTFFANVGLHWSQYVARRGVFSWEDARPDGLEDENRIDVVAARLGFGNQWQIRGLALGCEWVGLSVPVAVFNNEQVILDGDSIMQRTPGRGWERVGVSLRLFTVRVGYVF